MLRKITRSYWTIFTLILLSLLVQACATNPVIGTWSNIENPFEGMIESFEETVTFNSNGSFESMMFGREVDSGEEAECLGEGEWKVDEDDFVVADVKSTCKLSSGTETSNYTLEFYLLADGNLKELDSLFVYKKQ